MDSYLTCFICEKTFRKKEFLNSHLRNLHGVQPECHHKDSENEVSVKTPGKTPKGKQSQGDKRVSFQIPGKNTPNKTPKNENSLVKKQLTPGKPSAVKEFKGLSQNSASKKNNNSENEVSVKTPGKTPKGKQSQGDKRVSFQIPGNNTPNKTPKNENSLVKKQLTPGKPSALKEFKGLSQNSASKKNNNSEKEVSVKTPGKTPKGKQSQGDKRVSFQIPGKNTPNKTPKNENSLVKKQLTPGKPSALKEFKGLSQKSASKKNNNSENEVSVKTPGKTTKGKQSQGDKRVSFQIPGKNTPNKTPKNENSLVKKQLTPGKPSALKEFKGLSQNSASKKNNNSEKEVSVKTPGKTPKGKQSQGDKRVSFQIPGKNTPNKTPKNENSLVKKQLTPGKPSALKEFKGLSQKSASKKNNNSEKEVSVKTPGKTPKGKQSQGDKRVSFQIPGKNTPNKTPKNENSLVKKQLTPGKPSALKKFKGLSQNSASKKNSNSEKEVSVKTPGKTPKGKQSQGDKRVSFQIPGKNTPNKTPKNENSLVKKQLTPGKPSALKEFKGLSQKSASKKNNKITRANELLKGSARSLRSAMHPYHKISGRSSSRQVKVIKNVSSLTKKKPSGTSKTSNRKDASPALSPSVNVFKPPTAHSLTNGAADLEVIQSTCDALPPVGVSSTAETKKTPYCPPPGYFPHARYNEGNILCYEDLPDDCTENDLYNLFSRLGELKGCAIFMKRGYVEMKTPQEAVKAEKNLYKFAQDINYLASYSDSVPPVEASSDENYDKKKEKSHFCEGLILDDATVAAEPRMSMDSDINLEHANAQQEPSSTSTGDYETGIIGGSTSPKPSCSKNLSENYSDEENQ